MLFYIRCPTCSRIISYELDKYFEDCANIRDDPNMSQIEKQEAGAALLNKYDIRNICCRIRIMGLIPYHEIIVS